MSDAARTKVRGRVYLVGAGPGDPELLTVRAWKLLSAAEIVAYDELVSDAILALAPPSAERIAVGRRAKGCRHHEGRIHPLVIERALAGQDVVRLKGGDPFVFGRGGEEAEELAAARVPFEVVPGISAALGAAARTGIPLTHREVSSSVTFVTAHAKAGGEEVMATIPRTGTVVLYMGLGRLAETCAALVAGGRAKETPAAIVARATLPDQRLLVGTLEDLAERAAEAALPAPALVIVGEVVGKAVESPALVAALEGEARARAVGF